MEVHDAVGVEKREFPRPPHFLTVGGGGPYEPGVSAIGPRHMGWGNTMSESEPQLLSTTAVKLTLKKETLRILSSGELAKASGGVPRTTVSVDTDTCDIYCAWWSWFTK